MIMKEKCANGYKGGQSMNHRVIYLGFFLSKLPMGK